MPPIVAYHRITGPHTFPFEADARHAVTRFPFEWSRTPWPVAPVRVDENRITSAIAGLADRVVEFRKATVMDRIAEKLNRAAGVAKRATDAIEAAADQLIAREEELTTNRVKAFAPHHEMLDSHNRDLNQLEDALKLISNGIPLDASGSSPSAPNPPSTEKI
jgi:hypothetical protein